MKTTFQNPLKETTAVVPGRLQRLSTKTVGVLRQSAWVWWLTTAGTLLLPASAIAQNGRIERGQITSEALAANLLGDPATRNYQVYLPPSYDLSTNRYPAIYVLHGYGGDETGLVSILQSSLNSLIRQRQIGEMMAVFVNGANRLHGSFYLSSPVIGDFETYITRDLVQLIDEHYRTLRSRESRGVTGVSMGGWGTMHLALKFPGTFSVAVAEAGLYDAAGMLGVSVARQLGMIYPTNLAQFDGLPFPENACAAIYAGLTPNLERPNLYTDYPYERRDGQLVLVDSVFERALAGDVQHGDLARYLNEPVQLRGIKVVHGTADSVVPVAEARKFTNALAAAKLEFEYQEHPGGHDFLPGLALPFFSAHLEGAELYIAPPRLTLSLSTNGLHVAFLTQTNVLYTVESAAALRGSGTSWTERSRVTGDGHTATVESLCQGEAHFFRIRAANLP